MWGSYAYGALLWLALMVLEFLFFFGIGAFSVMCAGTKLSAAAVYALIQYFFVVPGYFCPGYGSGAPYGEAGSRRHYPLCP